MSHPCDHAAETPLGSIKVGDHLFRCLSQAGMHETMFMVAVASGNNPVVPIQKWTVVRDWVEVIPPKGKWEKIRRVRMIEAASERESKMVPLHKAHFSLFLSEEEARKNLFNNLEKEKVALLQRLINFSDFIAFNNP